MARPQAKNADEPNSTVLAPMDIAIRLLKLQQRVAALDILYDEEVTGLTKELSRLEADFIRHYQAMTSVKPAPKPLKQPGHKNGHSKQPRGVSE
ncbi:MAG TPA: hypothetical protein VFU63_11670 [Ktedonobacterales bacterium]|nr:hypothetical protein [Ktedonobacterales bacterium]